MGTSLAHRDPPPRLMAEGRSRMPLASCSLVCFPRLPVEAFQPLLGELDERAGHHETHRADQDDHADPDHHRQEHGIVHNDLRSRTLTSDKGKREILNLSVARAAEKCRGTTGSRRIQAGP